EALVDRLGGPRLRAWCRERAWPVPEPRPGELAGRVLVEEPVDLSRPFAPPPPERSAVEGGPSEGPPAPRGRASRVSRLAVAGCGILGLLIWLVVSGFAAIIAALAPFSASCARGEAA